MQLRQQISSKQRIEGFTLTELAIVVAVGGMILGAIWSTANQVFEMNKAKTAGNEVVQIVNGWQALFSNKRVDLGNWTDITALSLRQNVLPREMVRVGDVNYGYSPWNTPVEILSNSDSNGVAVRFLGLNAEQCNRVANAIFKNGMIWQQINGDPQWFPPSPYATTKSEPFTPSQISRLCVVGNANRVAVMYAMQ